MYRLLLTICCLCLLALLGRHEVSPSAPQALVWAMPGVCSGDCVSCGCPPAVAASGDCCCTRSRQLRHPALVPTFAVDAAPTDAVPHPLVLALRCAPCNRTPATLGATAIEQTLLPSAGVTIAPPAAFVRTLAPVILPALGHTAAAPPSPPPEITG